MTAQYRNLEAREINSLTVEITTALASNDAATARDALCEIEGIWIHTECPDIRSRAAALMRDNVTHGEFVRFSA